MRPRPETQCPCVLTSQRLVLDVVKVAGPRHRLSDALVPGVGRNPLQAEANMVAQVAVVTIVEGALRLDADAEVADGEPLQRHCCISVVWVGEVDEEILRPMAHHLDVTPQC